MRRLAIIIGIDQYPDPRDRLWGCVGDAQRFTGFLRSARGGSFDSICLLKDREATRRNVLNVLNGVANDGPWEQVVVYFAGHGSPDGIVAWDGLLAFGEFALAIRSIPARWHLLVMDACFSGAIHSHFDGIGGVHVGAIDVTRIYIELLRKASPGLRVITAVDRRTPSIEINAQGVFTTALLHAAQGARPDLGTRGVSAGRALAIVRKLLHRVGAPMPQGSGRLDDLPLALSDVLTPLGEAVPHSPQLQWMPAVGGSRKLRFKFRVDLAGRRLMQTQIQHVLQDEAGRRYHANSLVVLPGTNQEVLPLCDDVAENSLPRGRALMSVISVFDGYGRRLGQKISR